MAHNDPQGNDPNLDPDVYGLKFDGGKDRWELFPFELLKDLATQFSIRPPETMLTFNKWEEINKILELIEFFRTDKSGYDYLTLNSIAFHLMMILRGKAFTKEELERSSDQVRYDLVPMDDIAKVISIYSYGAKKYKDNNWKKVDPERYFSAFMRHFNTIFTQSRIDEESGFLHLHHALWNILTLKWFQIHNKPQKGGSDEARVLEAGCDRSPGKNQEDQSGQHHDIGSNSGRCGNSRSGHHIQESKESGRKKERPKAQNKDSIAGAKKSKGSTAKG